MKFFRLILIGVVSVLLLMPTLGMPALRAQGAQSVNSSFGTWEKAAAELGTRGNLFKPSYSAGLKLTDRVQVLAFGRTGVHPQSSNYRMTSVRAVYGKFAQGFSVNEKWSGTAWAATPQFDAASRPVGAVKITRLDRGTATKVIAKVFANCNISIYNAEIPERSKCGKKDVKRFGGYLTVTLEAENSLGAVRKTDLVIESKKLTYDQLVRIATGMEKVN